MTNLKEKIAKGAEFWPIENSVIDGLGHTIKAYGDGAKDMLDLIIDSCEKQVPAKCKTVDELVFTSGMQHLIEHLKSLKEEMK